MSSYEMLAIAPTICDTSQDQLRKAAFNFVLMSIALLSLLVHDICVLKVLN